MSPEEPAKTEPAHVEWVEIYRGPRRRAQVIIRVLTDATLPSRDARRAGVVDISAREGIVQVPKENLEQATKMIEMLKKSFPALFVVGAAKGD